MTTMLTDIVPPVVTDAQRRQLDEQGFFITDVLFDEPTLQGVRDGFRRVWDQLIENAKKSGDPLTLEQARTRPFMPQIELVDPACDAFCRHPVLLDLARQVLGDDIDLTWTQAVPKPPQEPGGATPDNAFAWHQDMWYATHGEYINGTNPDIFFPVETGLTMWAAISRTTVDNGTLWVLPGRHKEGLLPHVWDTATREWRGQYDTSWKIPVVMRAGQVLCFRKYLPHSSGPNVSNETRMAYQLGYSRPGLRTDGKYGLRPVLRGGAPVP